MCAARKMFPKRKLDETRSLSERQKEEAEPKEEQGQQNKRPRVQAGPGGTGTPLPFVMSLMGGGAEASTLDWKSLGENGKIKWNRLRFWEVAQTPWIQDKKRVSVL